MQNPLKTTPTIRVAKLQFCHDDTCQFSQELHLIVEVVDTELRRGSAVAISYTWGEFDRKDIFIGHDKQGASISINLGKEWKFQELIGRLAMVCLENGEEHGVENAACWIDQLCIPQAGDSALANRPRPVDKAQRINDLQISTYQIIKCANSLGLCSYFDRVWTRQELSYSRAVRLVRTSEDEIPCVKSTEDIHNLSTFADRLCTKYLLEGYPVEKAFGKLMAENISFWQRSHEALSEYGRSDDGRDLLSDQDEFTARQVRFLLGERLIKQEWNQQDEQFRIRTLLYKVGRLAGSSRKATKARDYVASVWVDCPGYILPMNFKTMCLPSLLEDAARKLENNYGVSPMASSGLLVSDGTKKGRCGSVLWRPTKYLGWKAVFGSHQIYDSVFVAHPPIPITAEREVPLSFLAPSSLALSRRAGEYSKVFSGQDATQVFDALKSVVKNWPEWILRKLSVSYGILLGSMTAQFVSNPGEMLNYVGRLFLYASSTQGLRLPGVDVEIYARWDRSPGMDHHQAVYKLVTLALGLDPQQCQSRGLKLMVSLNNPPCIGLTSMELGDGPVATNFQAGNHQGVGSVMTICTEAPKSRDLASRYGDLMLEGIMENSSSPARYRLAGMWVPFGSTSSFKPGAFFQAGCLDGLLV